MRTGLGRSALLMVSAVLAVAWVGGIASNAAAAAGADEAGDRLGTVISQAIRAEGPFFTPSEQALIARKCGYAAGEWDGYDVNISNNVLRCKNGRRVDDPEIKAVLRTAQPRIARSVRIAMARPDVQAAIRGVSEQATREAMRGLARRGW